VITAGSPDAADQRSARLAPLDLDDFIRTQLELLHLEQQAESRQATEQLAGRSPDALTRRGSALLRLQVHDEESGLGGRRIIVLRPTRTQSLPAHRFAPGDLVRLAERFEELASAEQPTGVVGRVRTDEISIALDHDDVDLPSSVNLLRIASDVTWRRMQHALRELGRVTEPATRRLVDVCTGKVAPSTRNPGPAWQPKAPLDKAQRAAVELAASSNEIALIHGPPGTGKTTTLVEVIDRSVSRGERVLATAPSNLAVDHLAEGLAARGLRIVRLGHPARLLPSVVAHSLAEQVLDSPEQKLLRDIRREISTARRKLDRADRTTRRERRADLRRLRDEQRQLERGITQGILDGAQVVLCTAVGAADPILGARRFDLVVLDEAAQALEAQSWIPLLRGDRAVLVGDHCQLPPTILSAEAARRGLATTLFERLMSSACGPDISRMLEVQYRMHGRIQAWSSQTFYDGQLQASPAVAEHVLHELDGVVAHDAIQEPLCFLDTAGCGLDESDGDEDGSRDNPGEARIVSLHVRSLLEAGVRPQDIAVISPYNAQVQRLREMLVEIDGLEIGTVDGLQGREKEAVVISTVRSNDRAETGFLSDLRRMNVALTRARRHLCIIGDSGTLSCDDGLAGLVSHLLQHADHRSAWGLS
jgi:ATP-dependent RNA/DNA helicase IGHMBP2